MAGRAAEPAWKRLARWKANYCPDDIAEAAEELEPDEAKAARARPEFAREVERIRLAEIVRPDREQQIHRLTLALVAPPCAFFTMDPDGTERPRRYDEIPPELQWLLVKRHTPQGMTTTLVAKEQIAIALAKMLEPAPHAPPEPPVGGATEDWARSVLAGQRAAYKRSRKRG
jgi:hypothetical protein